MLRRYFTHTDAYSKLNFRIYFKKDTFMPFQAFSAHTQTHNSAGEQPPSRDLYTVSRLNRAVRQLLEQQWHQVWLIGEVSNFSQPSSGHWYFTLKDQDAQISCAMFRGNNQSVRTPVKAGMQVMVRARLSLYEPRGNYQLIVEHLEPAGDGLLQQRYEALKRQLNNEGLFAAERKKTLPSVIRTLGVITSPSGAALHDVLAVLKRRDPRLTVIIYPAQVQGAEAPAALRSALATAIRRNEVDALLITRGGGSLEDLWAFNDEAFARDLAACPLPTVSAIGHEVDFTITDFVADLRAATPSAAAELLSQDDANTLQQLQQLHLRARRAWQQLQDKKQQKLHHLQARLHPLSPKRQIERQAQQLDDLDARLHRAMHFQISSRQQKIQALRHRLWQQDPAREISRHQQRLTQQQHRLQQAIQQYLYQRRQNFAALSQALQLVSPLHTLARGYSISFDEQQQLVRTTTQLAVGQRITTYLADGQIHSRIETIQATTNENEN